ncbi:hypothetical protein V6L77_00790 [Pannonibacter sp. Pt2-lr]
MRSHITRLWLIIARCTNCAVLHDKDEAALVFYGEGAGPEIATYLSDICCRAMKTAERGYMASGAYQRLGEVLYPPLGAGRFPHWHGNAPGYADPEMFEDSISEEARTRAVAARDAARVAVRLWQSETGKVRNTAAVGAGVMAGDAVPLNHGVRTDGPALQIGGQEMARPTILRGGRRGGGAAAAARQAAGAGGPAPPAAAPDAGAAAAADRDHHATDAG